MSSRKAFAWTFDWLVLSAWCAPVLWWISGGWITAVELGALLGAFLAWSGWRRLKGLTLGRWLIDREAVRELRSARRKPVPWDGFRLTRSEEIEDRAHGRD